MNVNWVASMSIIVAIFYTITRLKLASYTLMNQAEKFVTSYTEHPNQISMDVLQMDTFHGHQIQLILQVPHRLIGQ